MGSVSISGSVYVSATAPNTPGIGGASTKYLGSYYEGTGGSLTIANGANVNIDDFTDRDEGGDPAPIIVSNYAAISGNNIGAHSINTNIRTDINMTNLNFTGPATGGFVDCKIGSYSGKMYISSYLLPIYMASRTDYGTFTYSSITVPFSLRESTTTLGIALSGSKGDWSLNKTFTKDVTLQVTNYPSTGTMTAGAAITLLGNGKALYTDKLTLDASTYPLTLSGVATYANTVLTVKGQVKLNGTTNTLPREVTRNEGGTSVYYCTTTIQTGKVLKVLAGSAANTPITNYSQDGTTLKVWLPVGQHNLRVETDAGIAYTPPAAINVLATHNQPFTLYATEFDLSKYSVNLTTATSGNQSVSYNSVVYQSPFKTTITLTGTTSSGNNITIVGGSEGNVTLKGVSISGTTLPLQVTGGTVANITLSGTNNLASSNNHGLAIANGSKVKLTGTGADNLTLSATNATFNDLDNKGTLELSGPLALRATNSKLAPQPIAITGTPEIKLGTTRYYLTKLPSATVGTISDLTYTDDDTSMPTTLYNATAAADGNYYLWTPSPFRPAKFKGDKPTSGTLYLLSAPTPTNQHNGMLGYSAVTASIGNTIYATLPLAFAAATDGQTILMETAYTTPTGTTATLSKLTAGSNGEVTQTVTLDLNGYTLTTGLNTRLSSGKGALKLDDSRVGGKIAGSYAIEGCVHTELASGFLGTPTLGGKPVFRTKATGLPTNMDGIAVAYTSTALTALTARGVYAGGTATLWLPGEQQEVTLSNILPSSIEPVASATGSITAHDNTQLAAVPRLDIAYGNITVTASTGNASVSYGSKPYAATVSQSATKRLPIFGTATPDNGKENQIVVASAGSTGTAFLQLRGVNIQPRADKAAILVEAPTNISAYADNTLRGGGVSFGTEHAIKIIGGGTLTLADAPVADKGRLYTYGGAFGMDAKPAILSDAGTSLTIEGGTLVARHGNGTAADAIQATIQIKGGSVDALCQTRPTNNGTTAVYRVDVTTGLDPGQPYQCSYAQGGPSGGFHAIPDAAGKIYCWLPKQLLSDTKNKVTLTHPVSYKATDIEVAEVQDNDKNVAPIVVRVTTAGVQNAFGNLLDAFNSMTAGTENAHSRYDLQLLTGIGNLRTAQKLPANTDAYLDLGSFEIAAQNGSDVALDASASGAYLQVSGKGNIKNTVRIAGDVFITGVVPLTDAVVELDGKAVFRTLVKGLPSAAGNTYTYSYGQQQNMPFYLHDGLACLWLPDYGRSEELRFTVSGTGGSATEYTAGNITTVTQRTEAIPANPVGVVARLTYTDNSNKEQNQSYNTLAEAFSNAAKAYSAGGRVITIHLLTGISLSGTQEVSGQVTLNLDGKNLTSASGGSLGVNNGASLVVTDATTGTKGSLQANIRLVGSGQIFVPSYVKLTGNVYKAGAESDFLWRTLLNMGSDYISLDKVTYLGTDYAVRDREACLWLPVNTDQSATYAFTAGGATVNVTGYAIASNHNNDMTLGGTNHDARIGTKEYATLKEALDEAGTGGVGNTVELLKNITLTADYTLTGKEVTLQLGKYELAGSAKITLSAGAALTVTSQGGNGKIKTPIQLSGGDLYIGQDIDGGSIGLPDPDPTKRVGVAGADGLPLYRELVTNIPTSIPTGAYDYTYTELDEGDNPVTATQQKGTFRVRGGVACLWLKPYNARMLIFNVGGAEFPTKNVTVNTDHFNTETYGVNDVAQIRNGKKYASLSAAFADAAGRTIVLLKNAALTAHVTVAGSTKLETGDYTITSQQVGDLTATITVPTASNLEITGKGSVNARFAISPSTPGTTYSNGNLQVERTVSLTGSLSLGSAQGLLRASAEGLPGAQAVSYEYGYDPNKQDGEVKTSSSGTLCLWLKANSSATNFYVNVPGSKSYLATQVVINGSHANPISFTEVDAVAEVGGVAFDKLIDAFNALTSANAEVKLRKEESALTGTLALPGGLARGTLNLQDNRITGNNLTLSAADGQLVVRGGTLAGTLALIGDVFAAQDVTMTNATVSNNGKTLWRVFLTLPKPATGQFSYTLGTSQAAEKGISTNLRDAAADKSVACLWLPSSNVARPLTVTVDGKEYALDNVVIASTHGNELDVTNGNLPVAEADGKQYASLASALANAGASAVKLLRDLTMTTKQAIAANQTINLNKYAVTSSNGGFDVATSCTLTLANGQLLGTLNLAGEGTAVAGSDVKIAGIVLDKNRNEVYRVLVKVDAATRCLWAATSTEEEDRKIDTDYEVTIPANLANHNASLTAYKALLIGNDTDWKAEYANTRLTLNPGVVFTLPESTDATLNRLIFRDGAKVAGKGQVRATEGIRYVRTLTKDKWDDIALPYTATRITTVDDKGKTVALTPAYGSGTAGHFWLRTVAANGALTNVNSAEMTANQFYLIAVPSSMDGKEITFVSGPNQLLRRDKALAVKPASGFAAYANGTLGEITVDQPCYILNGEGDTFVRMENNPNILPFRGYLLADAATTAITPMLRAGGLPTGIQPVVDGRLRVTTRQGALTVACEKTVTVRVFTMNGFPVATFRLDAGERTINLPTGIYIVNRQKVWVR